MCKFFRITRQRICGNHADIRLNGLCNEDDDDDNNTMTLLDFALLCVGGRRSNRPTNDLT